MTLHFITGNKNKLFEAQSVIPGVEQLDINLPEIQEIDAHKIIEAKLQEAFNRHDGEFIVEDTSLYLACLNGLPGPLIKWFMKAIDVGGLADLAERFNNQEAEAKTIIGYARNKDDIKYFEGVIKGKIVHPRGETKFGWDPIFQPEGYDKTFAEMGIEEKNTISMRRLAMNKLDNYLKTL